MNCQPLVAGGTHSSEHNGMVTESTGSYVAVAVCYLAVSSLAASHFSVS